MIWYLFSKRFILILIYHILGTITNNQMISTINKSLTFCTKIWVVVNNYLELDFIHLCFYYENQFNYSISLSSLGALLLWRKDIFGFGNLPWRKDGFGLRISKSAGSLLFPMDGDWWRLALWRKDGFLTVFFIGVFLSMGDLIGVFLDDL